MAIHIQSGKNSLSSNLKCSNIQSIPFKIQADVDANVTKYFNNYISKDDDGTLKATFRGYPLKGQVIELPQHYKGVVLHESIKPVTDKDERKFYVINEFDSFTHWNWDRKPSKNDAINQALDWIDIAEALHSPITEE